MELIESVFAKCLKGEYNIGWDMSYHVRDVYGIDLYGNKINDKRQRKYDVNKLKEDMRRMFFESIEGRKSAQVNRIGVNIKGYAEPLYTFDAQRNKRQLYYLDIVFDKNSKQQMNLIKHVQNIILFVIDREKYKPLFEMARYVKYKTPEERRHGDGSIEWDMYGIVKQFGQDIGSELMWHEREIRKWDE